MDTKKLTIIAFLILIGFFSGFFVNMYEIYPYSALKEFYIDNQRNISEIEIYEDDVSSLIHVNTIDSRIQIQNNLIDFIWNTNNLPLHEPTRIETNITSQEYLNFKNLHSIDKITIEMDYGVDSVAYFFKPNVSNDKLIIYHQGHGGDFSKGKNTIQYFLEKNYAVIAFSMPLLGMNSQPIVDHPQFGKIKITSHNHFELLENENFSPIKFFVEPIIVTINFLENNYNYNSYHMVGISGGGWTSTLAPAIDDRISQSYSVAGSYPIFLRNETKNFGDYEQHNLDLYKIANYLDLYVLASTGSERKFIQIFNKYDPCCFDTDSYSIYENEIKDTVRKLGTGEFNILLDETHNKHMISNHALELIITNIEK